MTASLPNVTLSQRVTRSEDALFQEVSGEAVLLDLASEHYFGLDPVGTRIWTLLGQHDSLEAICDVLCDEYAAEPDRIRSDLQALIGQLSDAGLVKLS